MTSRCCEFSPHSLSKLPLSELQRPSYVSYSGSSVSPHPWLHPLSVASAVDKLYPTGQCNLLSLVALDSARTRWGWLGDDDAGDRSLGMGVIR